ncbi:SGNH hydrolase [Microthyrium microscopicum]|uniref:SGNH hydrolase n=1 Tax=Microthyrium microscopicum TaxID=703497 RepID=A0A6A6U3G2_9PEZI|nr:SGNH hydrolase [Microthyrium microscopicum]
MLSSLSFLLALACSAVNAAPKVLICSDSTTADYAKTNDLQGWGYFLNEYMSIKVVNMAKNGRSTRSFIREGLWAKLLADTQPGDFVIIEMGHNDVGGPPTA